MRLKIKKGDQVQVIAGQDKGKKGAVLSVSPTKMKIKVQGVKLMTHFDKKDGMKTLESYIDYSNVKLVEATAAKQAGKKAAAKKKPSKSKNA